MKQYILELVQYRELLLNLIINELKLRYRNSVLGFLWTILNPVLYLLILAAVFSQIIKFQMDNYIMYLFTGLTAFTMIQQTVTTATASIVNNQALIRKVYIPKIIFPLSNILARFIDHVILTVILLGFMVVFKMPFSASLLIIPFIIVMHFFFSLGLSLIFAVAYIKIRDVEHIVAIAFQALFFATPIIYPLEVLPANLRPFFLLNPFYYYVQLLRYPVYHASLPPLEIFLGASLIMIVSCAVGFYIFHKQEKYFVFHLS